MSVDAEAVAGRLIEAFGAIDFDGMRAQLGDDLRAYTVHAARGSRTLHNHAAHLLRTRNGKVSEWWMVEALPAESDAFWAADAAD